MNNIIQKTRKQKKTKKEGMEENGPPPSIYKYEKYKYNYIKPNKLKRKSRTKSNNNQDIWER